MDERDDLGFAHRMADLAGRVSMDLLRAGGIATETKSDGSPVTQVDVLVERELRALVERERPGDGFWGEESDQREPGADRWVVDPIDGTRSLLAGEPEWGTLIAHARDHSARLGLVSSPPLRRRWWAALGAGAWTAAVSETGALGEPEPLRVTTTERLNHAQVGLWPPPWRAGERALTPAAGLAAAAERIVPDLAPFRHTWNTWNDRAPKDHAADWSGRSDRTRAVSAPSLPPKPSTGSGTCHGGLLVTTGRLDAFLLTGAGPWDVAALVPIVRGAGGEFSDLNGEDRFDTGLALFSNSRVHDQALDAARRARS